MEEQKKKLLFVRLSSLGDVIFNIPLVNVLKDSGYEVTWLVSEKGLQVVQNNPCVDKVILAPVEKWKKRGFCLENFKEYLEILKQIRNEKFDIAIDSQMMLKSAYWMLFSGAKRRIVARKCRELAFLGGNEWVEEIERVSTIPIVMHYLRYAHYLNLPMENIKVSLPTRTPEQIARVDELLKDLNKNKPLVVIAPATTWDNKHWNKDNWKIVVDNIGSACNVVFTGGPKDSELIEYINQGRHLNLAGKTDVLELAEVFSRANLVMAPDSGSAHLAWATGKPKVITIFTCTPKQILAPLGSPDKYLALGGTELPCQSCFKRKCKRKKTKNACTNFPNPKDVINAVENLLNG